MSRLVFLYVSWIIISTTSVITHIQIRLAVMASNLWTAFSTVIWIEWTATPVAVAVMALASTVMRSGRYTPTHCTIAIWICSVTCATISP